jgi:UDP-N-acetylmuramoyl-tripeptide--D-alanyl-D-alanine ligase
MELNRVIQESFATLAASANGKVLSGNPEILINGHFTDTRSPVRGGLYVALRGERFDGNEFAREAVERHGAAAVLVDREHALKGFPEYAGAILVDDARAAYLALAAAHRQKLSQCLWFGVTGSVGKSTTKDMLWHILSGAKPGQKIHKAQGSFNNEVGLSKTILETSADTQAAVLEIGTNHPGEIETLTSVARPDIAVITRAAESHLEAFGSVENVAREKGSILKFQTPNDIAVLNADDVHFELWKSMAQGRVISFGVLHDADVSATKIKIDDMGRANFRVEFKGSSVTCSLRVPGTHQVSNALAAIAAVMPAGVSLERAAELAGTFEGTARRFSVHRAGGVTLIDDAYNANPASFKAALETLSTLSATRRFVVAGGMLELGAQSETRHRELGAALAQLDLSSLAVVGELAQSIGAAAVDHGHDAFAMNVHDTPEDAAETLLRMLRPGDAVLVKGSHGINLDRCVNALLSKLSA